MLLVSRWTIRRRVVEFGLEEITGFSDIANEQLDDLWVRSWMLHFKWLSKIARDSNTTASTKVKYWPCRPNKSSIEMGCGSVQENILCSRTQQFVAHRWASQSSQLGIRHSWGN